MAKLIKKLDFITVPKTGERVWLRRARLSGRKKLLAKTPQMTAYQQDAIDLHRENEAAEKVARDAGVEFTPRKLDDRSIPESELNAIAEFLGKLALSIDEGDGDEDPITDRADLVEYFEYATTAALLHIIGMAGLQMTMLDAGTTLKAVMATQGDEAATPAAAPDPETGG